MKEDKELIKEIKKRLRKASPMAVSAFAFTICNILQKGISYLTTPLFTRLLTTEQYGQFTLYQSWLNILLVFATLKLTSGVYHKGLIEFSETKDSFISSMLGLTTTLTVVVAIVYLVFKPIFDNVIGLPDCVILLIFLELLTEPALTFWSANQRHHYKYKALLLVTLVIAIIQPCVGLIAVLRFEEKGIARIASVVLINALVGLIMYIYLASKGKTFYNKKYWKYALAFNLPLIPHYLSNTILVQSDRVMINYFFGESDAAIYALVYQVSMAMFLIISALNSTLMPWVFQKCKSESYQDISKTGNELVVFVAIISLIPGLLGPEVIAFFGGSSYVDGVSLVPVVAMTVFLQFIYYLFVYIEYYFSETKVVMLSTMGAAILNIVLNYILLPIFGYKAAAYTTYVSYAVYALLHFVCMRYTLKKNQVYKKVYNGKMILCITAALFVISELFVILYEFTVLRYALIALLIIFGILLRKSIRNLLLRIKK